MRNGVVVVNYKPSSVFGEQDLTECKARVLAETIMTTHPKFTKFRNNFFGTELCNSNDFENFYIWFVDNGVYSKMKFNINKLILEDVN